MIICGREMRIKFFPKLLVYPFPLLNVFFVGDVQSEIQQYTKEAAEISNSAGVSSLDQVEQMYKLEP